MGQTILSDKFDKGKKYPSVSDFIFEFDLLKQVINEGADDGFSAKLEILRKGRSVGQKGLMDFFTTFINIRNTYAHPDEKAGPKDQKRKWPLGDEYYSLINSLMHTALSELIDDFEILKEYKPILAKTLDDKGNKGKFELEIGTKGSELELKLSNEDLRFVSTDVRYLLDPDEKLFVKFYYSKIPQLNPDVAKKIIDSEKAKAMEPHMVEMIENKLADDGKIDDMEYLILRDTAKTSSISLERLFQLIEKVKNQLKVKGTVGTPDNKGDIFVETKDDSTSFSFSPWWLHYLSMVPKIDKNTVKKEQANEKKIEKKIRTLKKSKKSLPVSKRLDNAKKNLKNKKVQKSKQLKSLNAQIEKKREMRKKAKAPERKRALLAEIEEIKIKADEKREYFDSQINDLSMTVERIDEEKGEKANEIDSKILSLDTQLDEYSRFTQWGMHKNLWQEINQYVDHLLDVNLNGGMPSTPEGDEEVEVPKWANSQNQWQIGQLAYTYWAKIHQAESPLGIAYHVGYAISRKFKWLPGNIDESLIEILNKPASLIWTSIDDQWAAKIDIDGTLGQKRIEIFSDMLKDYQKELLDLGANVRCVPNDAPEDFDGDKDGFFMPLKKFLKEKNKYTITAIYTRIWPVDSFYKNGGINLEAINQYEKEMITMLQLFSNSIVQLNDYALENGINQETIVERFDQYNRLKEIMFKEFEKKYPVGTLFRPKKDEDNTWREYAAKELGLSNYLYDMIASNFRFSSGYNTRKYLKEQRDKHKPGTKEYQDYDEKITLFQLGAQFK